MAHDPGEQDVGQRRQGHGRARVARVGRLRGVHGQAPDDVDPELFERRRRRRSGAPCRTWPHPTHVWTWGGGTGSSVDGGGASQVACRAWHGGCRSHPTATSPWAWSAPTRPSRAAPGGHMMADERFANPAGLLQGGFLAAFCDSSMGAAAVTFVEGPQGLGGQRRDEGQLPRPGAHRRGPHLRGARWSRAGPGWPSWRPRCTTATAGWWPGPAPPTCSATALTGPGRRRRRGRPSGRFLRGRGRWGRMTGRHGSRRCPRAREGARCGTTGRGGAPRVGLFGVQSPMPTPVAPPRAGPTLVHLVVDYVKQETLDPPPGAGPVPGLRHHRLGRPGPRPGPAAGRAPARAPDRDRRAFARQSLLGALSDRGRGGRGRHRPGRVADHQGPGGAPAAAASRTKEDSA